MITYNAEKYIEQAISSILNQTERNIVLLVVNNGSTDGTGKILHKMAASDTRLHFYENRLNWKYDDGTSIMRDGVLRIWPLQDQELLGEYVSIVDSDDWLQPTFVEKMYHAAKNVEADIAVCGVKFMLDGVKDIGERLPPAIMTRNLSGVSEIIRRTYPQLHNSFRTWWAKLFRTDFFLHYYDEAWQAIGGKNGQEFDTVIMLRYLCHARSFAGISKALYFFRQSSGSTYGNRPPIYYRVLEAEELVKTGERFLRTFHADNTENRTFLLQLHWAYMNESLQCLNVRHEGFSARDELSFIAAFLNSSTTAQCYNGNEEPMLRTALFYSKIVFERGGKKKSLYSSYLIRLLYLEDKLKERSGSLLLYPILAGCLYDRENVRKLGLNLIPKIAENSQCRRFLSESQTFQEHEMRSFSACPRFWPKGISAELNTEELEQKLEAAAENMDYHAICDLIEKISAVNPLDRKAMLYRIQMARIARMDELSAVLAGTAVSLWPADPEMQSLCWEILQKEGKICSD